MFRLGSLWYGTGLGFATYRVFKKRFVPTEKAQEAGEGEVSEGK